jgi:hypothetical protein
MNVRGLAVAAIAAGLCVAFPVLGAAPPGWAVAGSAPADYDFAVDTSTAASGKTSASITAKPGAKKDGFGALMQTVAADDYRGARWRLSGYLRVEAADRALMWMRVDGSGGKILAFDNMDSRPVSGTTGWKQYNIVLDVPPESVDIAFGFLLVGSGKLWGDGFRLENVDATVPVTASGPVLARAPANPDFEGTVSSQSAIWVPRRFSFHLANCDVPNFGNACREMGRSIGSILRQLGARDVAVNNYEATFSALVPIESARPVPANPQIVPARWDTVTLDLSIASNPAHGAEPTSQFAAGFLALFATRNISQNGGARGTTTLEVLRPISATAP